jgi:hypothetical protein
VSHHGTWIIPARDQTVCSRSQVQRWCHAFYTQTNDPLNFFRNHDVVTEFASNRLSDLIGCSKDTVGVATQSTGSVNAHPSSTPEFYPDILQGKSTVGAT